MRMYCSAYGCNQSHLSGSKISFHKFPMKDKILLQKWTNALRRDGFNVTKYSKLCSKHFTPDSFIPSVTNYTQLKEGAIPSLFDFPMQLQKKSIKLRGPKKLLIPIASLEKTGISNPLKCEYPITCTTLEAEHNYFENFDMMKKNFMKVEDMENILYYLKNAKFPPNFSDLQVKRLNFIKKSHRYVLKNGELFLRGKNKYLKIIDNVKDQQKIIANAHHGNGGTTSIGTHFGINKTQKIICEKFFWPGIYQGIIKYVRCCKICQLSNTRCVKSSLQSIFIIPKAWHQIMIDLWPMPESEAGYKYILSAICYFSKYLVAIPLKDKSAKSVVEGLYIIVNTHSSHKIQINNKVPEFVNPICDKFYNYCGITQILTSAYHIGANSVVRRIRRTIQERISKTVQDLVWDWPKTLIGAVEIYNTCAHSPSGVSPYELMYSRKPAPLFERQIKLEESESVPENVMSYPHARTPPQEFDTGSTQNKQKIYHDKPLDELQKMLIKNEQIVNRKLGKLAKPLSRPSTMNEKFDTDEPKKKLTPKEQSNEKIFKGLTKLADLSGEDEIPASKLCYQSLNMPPKKISLLKLKMIFNAEKGDNNLRKLVPKIEKTYLKVKASQIQDSLGKMAPEKKINAKISQSFVSSNNKENIKINMKGKQEIVCTKPDDSIFKYMQYPCDMEKCIIYGKCVAPSYSTKRGPECCQESCQLGCVCSSLLLGKPKIKHCNKAYCLFGCVCSIRCLRAIYENNNNYDSHVLPSKRLRKPQFISWPDDVVL